MGSANLTDGGSSANDELVHEFDVNDDECQNWFRSLTLFAHECMAYLCHSLKICTD